jgi:ABC-type transport system substrate-binding protein
MKRILATILILALLLSATGCATVANVTPMSTAAAAAATEAPSATAAATATTDTATATPEPAIADLSAYADATAITLSATIVVDGAGAEVNGNVVTITSGGDYVLSGTLADGQVVVDSGDDGTVTLVLAGVDIHNSAGAPLYVAGAKDTVIILADGTENRLSDGDSYVLVKRARTNPTLPCSARTTWTISGGGLYPSWPI